MAYVVAAYVVMAYVVMAYVVMAYGVMAYGVMAYGVMAYIGMAYTGMAYTVTAYIATAYIVMACVHSILACWSHGGDRGTVRYLYRVTALYTGNPLRAMPLPTSDTPTEQPTPGRKDRSAITNVP